MIAPRLPRQLFFATILVTLYAVAPEAGNTDQIAVSFREGLKCSIAKNGAEYMTVDLADFTTKGEMLLGRAKPQLRPVSPDGANVPFVIVMGADDADILLVDLKKKTVKRQEMYRGKYIHVGEVEWVTTRTIGLRAHRASGQYIVYDIVKRTSDLLNEEGALVWNAKGQNYASIFGKLQWYYGRVPSEIVPPEELLVSEALRYNSYWVYPKPLHGFITDREYTTWTSDISVRQYGKGSEQPPIVRTRGVAISANHVLSTVVFVGETAWAGFFEHVYPLGKWDEVVESNVVLLDAHRVDTNPPLVEAINVKKQPIPSIVPKTKQDYIDLTINLSAKWNSKTSCLELWRTSGWQHKDKMKKLGEVPIDLTKMQLGAYQPVQSEWMRVTTDEDR